MITRIVVADHAGVRFFDASGPRPALREAGSLDNPEARLPDRELKSDRPGRVFARLPRRAAGAAQFRIPPLAASAGHSGTPPKSLRDASSANSAQPVAPEPSTG